jgi:hypothetical protein
MSQSFRLAACVVSAALGLISCTNQPDPPQPATSVLKTVAIYYADPVEQAAFKAALERAAIPYKVDMRDGNEMIRWDGRFNAQVEKIKSDLFGPEIASNSNISLGDAKQQKAFTDWLSVRGIKYEIVRKRGKDYVVWDGPENLGREFIDKLGSKCGETVARTDEKRRPCG